MESDKKFSLFVISYLTTYDYEKTEMVVGIAVLARALRQLAFQAL